MAGSLQIEYYDREGKPMDMNTWAEKHSDPVYKRVAESHVGHLWVSTVWLGLDHGFGSERPVIFETMVFNTMDEDKRWDEEICERYCTEEEALAGHAAIVQRIQFIINEEPTLI